MLSTFQPELETLKNRFILHAFFERELDVNLSHKFCGFMCNVLNVRPKYLVDLTLNNYRI